MMGTSVYLSGVSLYPSPNRKSKGKGIFCGSHPVSKENSILFL